MLRRSGIFQFLCFFLIISIFFNIAFGEGTINILNTRTRARTLSWEELENVFRHGTVEKEIPEGYSYGYVLVSNSWPRGTNLVSNTFWHGKRFVADTSTTGYITNAMGNGLVNIQTMPGKLYIGQLKDVRKDLEALQLDNKSSLIVDYGNGGGDEIRLVNSRKRIFLGRGTDWAPAPYARIFSFFVLRLFDNPHALEVSLRDPAEMVEIEQDSGLEDKDMSAEQLFSQKMQDIPV